jgi:cyanophycinase-like exopeptidase
MAVDEATAAIVTRDSIRVMGNSYVLLYDQQDWQRQQKEWGRVYRPFKMYRSGEIIKSMNQ